MGARKYLYKIIYGTLKQEILDGVYPCGTLLPSERVICERFNVERTTARKALEMLVSNGLVEKRAGIGTEVIYNRDVLAAPSKAQTIGFFINEEVCVKRITQPYYADLFYYLERECTANRQQLIYSNIGSVADLQEICCKYPFKAIIFITKTNPELIEQGKKMNIPLLLINEEYDGVPSMYCDHMGGASLALEHLAQMGHKRIGIISGPKGYLTTKNMMAACYSQIADLGLEIPHENIVSGDWTYQSGYEAARSLVCERRPEERPTALFVFNDIMAVGAIRALRNHSISVPDEVSVIGFDNMEQLKFSEPDLTTVDSNTEGLAKLVVESIVHSTLSLYAQGAKLIVPVTLIKRKTVGHCNTAVP